MFMLFLFLFLCTTLISATELVAPNSGSSFGHAVSVFGDWSVVGDPFSVAGRAFVFKRISNTWELITTLGHVDVSFGDEFGYSVSVGTEYIVVSAPNQFNQGRVYVYRYFEEEWKLSSVLAPPLSYQYGRFGETVSIEGDVRIAVGHPGADFMLNMGAGLVNVYHLVGWGSWYLTNSIHPTGDVIPYSNFGSHVVVADGNRILISAPFHNQGLVYLFKLDDHIWHLERTLEGDGDDSFGRFIGMSDSNIVVASNSKVFTFFDYGERVSVIDKNVYAMTVSKNLLILSTNQVIHTYTFSHGKWYLVEQIFDEKTYSALSVHNTTLIMGETYSNRVTSISEYYFTAVPTSSPSISPTNSPLVPTTSMPSASPTNAPTNEKIEISNNLLLGIFIPLSVLSLVCTGFCFYFQGNKEKIKEILKPHI